MSKSSQPAAKYRLDYQPPAYTIDTVDLEFDLDCHQTRVVAQSYVRRLNEQVPTLTLDGEALDLLSLKIDGQPWSDYQLTEKELHIRNVPKQFSLHIETQIFPEKNTSLQGLYYASNTLCTQCEAEGFRRITFFLDRPDVLARYTTKVCARREEYPFLLSNGNRADSGVLDSGKHWVKWEDPFVKPCYLFALVAGDFDLLEDRFVTRSSKTVKLELYVEKGQADKTAHAMESLKKSMKWDEQRFGLEYDLDVYMTVAVDFFNAGAMENKGLNIFNTKYILANPQTATDEDLHNVEAVVAHEYFHNWTGNRVTCRDWFQLSLKEGLTVFRDQLFSADMGSDGIERIKQVKVMRGAQFLEDAGPMAHPIRPDKVIEMDNFYTCTVYDKGAEVIRMMHRILGEDRFQKGMQCYIERHDGCAVTCDDFVQAMEDASRVDLTLFRRWYEQSGTPRVRVETCYQADQQIYKLVCTQHTPSTPDQVQKKPLHIPLQVSLYAPDGQRTHQALLELKSQQQEFEFQGVSQSPIVSVLDDFSAPIKLDMDYTKEQLSILATMSEDPFSRWDALQTLIAQLFTKKVDYMQEETDFTPLNDAFSRTLDSRMSDPCYQAKLLEFPSTTDLMERFEVVEPANICDARGYFVKQLGQNLEQSWQSCYHQCTQQVDSSTIRALKNVCVYYLCQASEGFEDKILALFRQATNMTDRIGALTAARDANFSCFQTMLDEFEQQWQDDALVMDKWMALQSANPSGDAIERVQELLKHRHFSLKNPNRVYALIGTFANRNLKAFHEKSGRGYQFLQSIVIELDTINPAVASRMVTPLINFQRYASCYQDKMKESLREIADAPNISVNVIEKVNKALTEH